MTPESAEDEQASSDDDWTPRGRAEAAHKRELERVQARVTLPPSEGVRLRDTAGPDGAPTIRAGAPTARSNTPIRRAPRLCEGVISQARASEPIEHEVNPPPSGGEQVCRHPMESEAFPGWISRSGQTEKDREENARRRAHGCQRPDKPGNAPWRGASYRRINRMLWMAGCGKIASYKTALWRLSGGKKRRRRQKVNEVRSIRPELGCACSVHAKGYRKKRFLDTQMKWKRQLESGEKVLILPPSDTGVNWFEIDYRTL